MNKLEKAVTLKKATDLLCEGDKYKTFKYYLKKVLRETKRQNDILQENDPYEFIWGSAIIVYTWDNISVRNLKSGAYIDLITNLSNLSEVFEYVLYS